MSKPMSQNKTVFLSQEKDKMSSQKEGNTLESDKKNKKLVNQSNRFDLTKEKFFFSKDMEHSFSKRYFEDFNDVFVKGLNVGDIDSLLLDIKERLVAYNNIYDFIKNNVDYFKITYLLKHLGAIPFSQLQSHLGIESNKLTYILKKLINSGDIKNALDLSDDIRFKKNIYKLIQGKKTSSFYELRKDDEAFFELIEKYLTPDFKDMVLSAKKGFEIAVREYRTLQFEKDEKLGEKMYKQKTKFERVKYELFSLDMKIIRYYDFYRVVVIRKEITSEKKLRKILEELARSGVIVMEGFGELLTIKILGGK